MMISKSGVTEVNHLVSDPDGHIHTKDIREGILDAKKLK